MDKYEFEGPTALPPPSYKRVKIDNHAPVVSEVDDKIVAEVKENKPVSSNVWKTGTAIAVLKGTANQIAKGVVADLSKGESKATELDDSLSLTKEDSFSFSFDEGKEVIEDEEVETINTYVPDNTKSEIFEFPTSWISNTGILIMNNVIKSDIPTGGYMSDPRHTGSRFFFSNSTSTLSDIAEEETIKVLQEITIGTSNFVWKMLS
jgi:hypothetical protein